jgi:O-antigen ligase
MQAVLTNRQNLIIATIGTLALSFMLLALNPLIVIAVCLGIAALIVVSRYPELALYLLVISVPGQVTTSVSVGSTRFTLTQIAVFLAIFGWFGSRVIFKQRFVPTPTPLLLPFFALYLAVMILSFAVAEDFSLAVAELYRWSVAFLTYILACSLIKTPRQFWLLVGALVLGTVLGAAWGVKTSVFKDGPPSYAIAYNLSRAFGTFDKPNSFAGFVEMGLPLLYALTLLMWQRRSRAVQNWFRREGQTRTAEYKEAVSAWWWFAALGFGFLISVAGIFLSYSRGAWLGLAVCALVMLAAVGRKAIPIWLVGGGTVLLVVFSFQTGVIPDEYFSRITAVSEQFQPFDVRTVIVNDDNFAIVERMAMWQAGGNMFLSSPLLGVGVGNFNARYPDFFADIWVNSQGHAHNYYIHAAAETGIIGTIAYLLLLGAALLQGWRVLRRTVNPAYQKVAWGVFGSIIAVAVHNLTENLHVLSMGITWGAMLALFYLIEKLDAPAPLTNSNSVAPPSRSTGSV